MGGTQTKEAVEYFTAVAHSDIHPDEKNFIEHLIRYKKNICSGAELYRSALPALRELIPSCVQTRRVRWILHLCLQQLEHASSNYSQAPSEAFLALLHITEFIVRYANYVSHGDAAELLRIMMGDETTSSNSNELTNNDSQGTNTEAHKLCNALIEYCVTVPLNVLTVEAHSEVISLLLSMTSSALYHPTTFDEKYMDVFTEMMIGSEGIAPFLSTLLRRVVDWGAGRLPSQPLLYRNGYQPSFRNLYNVFGSNRGNNSISYGENLGRHCGQLLSVLIAHQKGNGRNPALDYIKGIQDGEQVQFKPLLIALTTRLQVCPSLCMVLYALIYDHPTFLHTVITAFPKELLDLIQEVLHLSYAVVTDTGYTITTPTTPLGESYHITIPNEEDELSPETIMSIMKDMTLFSNPFISFMTSTLVLLFTQDQVLNKYMSDTVVEPRFKLDRYLGKIPISSLCIIVLAHGIVRAMNEKNEPLAAVFLPSLSNLAPFIHDIDPHTSQQLLRLLMMTQRKLRRAVEHAGSTTTVLDDDVANGIPRDKEMNNKDMENKENAIAQMFARQLSSLVEALEGMLQGEDRHNDSLVYELLYNKDKLEDGIVVDNPNSLIAKARKTIQPLIRIVDFYETELASVTSADSHRDILSIIRRATEERNGGNTTIQEQQQQQGTPRSSIKPVGQAMWKAKEILFVYEESSHSYDFFGPFVWATLLGDAAYPGGLLWTVDTTVLDMFPR
ncbi:uncharacterized protein TM35_000062170 [Trypanosoma theileri]|uniref:Dymeclin n=1 Tax=Trypanosoma theileri TaxID=67003 RepID=A0A1X0P2R5_9TRYP|nr:uncharacterized protein TM35_000062170 [Trypanosoma theileri]ORC91212.1 hypothetical protein TM35_000062170 [Trypanosoma theileri]